MIFVFIITMFGVLTLIRTLKLFVREKFINVKVMKLLFCVMCVLFATVIYVCPHSYFLSWSVSVMFAVLPRIWFYFFTRKREQEFKDNFCHYLDDIVVEMRTGHSFRQSLQRSHERWPAFVHHKFSKILDLLRFSTDSLIDSALSKDKFLKSIIEEFKTIDSHSHNSLARLISLRERLRTESDYRRRSGHVTLQIRTQALILTVLYIATFVFVMCTNNYKDIIKELLLSSLLFGMGLCVIFLYGRRYKWKV